MTGPARPAEAAAPVSKRRDRLVQTLDQKLPTVSMRLYTRVAWAAVTVLVLIVGTGAAVRLTGSGLGCPDWPNCYEDGRLTAELSTHDWIEFGNRLLTGVVGLPCVLAWLLAFRLKPYRRELTWIAFTLPVGVLGQAVLGGMTVWYGLHPSLVMAHYLLSMVLLIGAVGLVWRCKHPPGSRGRTPDKRSVWLTRALLPVGFLTLAAGTLATAAGPHAGGSGTGDEVVRFTFKGADTVDWAIHRHGNVAQVLGILVIVALVVLRRRKADGQAQLALAATLVLLGLQGVTGISQYYMELPAEIVWVHVLLASLTWMTLVWAALAMGAIDKASPPPPAAPEPGREQEREPVTA